MLYSVYGAMGFVGGEFFRRGGVLIPKLVDEAFSPNIVYFISTIHNYNVFDDPFLDINTNLVKLIQVLEANRKKYGSEFIFTFVSSWFVYGNTPDYPAREDSFCDPKGFYSITKRTAEQLVISYCETFGISYRILRLPNVLGVGDEKVSKKKNALQYLMREMVLGNPIDLYYGGDFYRDYMDVRDVADAIRFICDREDTLNQVHNIVGENSNKKFGDVIKFCHALTDKKSTITEAVDHEFHGTVQTKSIRMDYRKLADLGWKPSHHFWTETLFEIIEAYENELHIPG